MPLRSAACLFYILTLASVPLLLPLPQPHCCFHSCRRHCNHLTPPPQKHSHLSGAVLSFVNFSFFLNLSFFSPLSPVTCPLFPLHFPLPLLPLSHLLLSPPFSPPSVTGKDFLIFFFCFSCQLLGLFRIVSTPPNSSLAFLSPISHSLPPPTPSTTSTTLHSLVCALFPSPWLLAAGTSHSMHPIIPCSLPPPLCCSVSANIY